MSHVCLGVGKAVVSHSNTDATPVGGGYGASPNLLSSFMSSLCLNEWMHFCGKKAPTPDFMRG